MLTTNSKFSARKTRRSQIQTADKSIKIFKLSIWLFIIFMSIFWLIRRPNHSSVEFAPEVREIWAVRSIDTMKNSRDRARAWSSPAYDAEIKKEMKTIKSLGANYVAVGTPYDDEFLPYLQRWVDAAREEGLGVWYRGTFSRYEGWFEYPKNMSPAELLVASEKFILEHPDLFEDGDIFDACPECENAGHWPQPYRDAQYNQFIADKEKVLTGAFEEINKDVEVSYASIIGGRAKDVMDQAAFDSLGNVVALDHYADTAENYEQYVDYFWDEHHTRVLFSEVGAPIPDLHGAMTEEEQAGFIEQVFEKLYYQREKVIGVNYWVYSNGTTAIVDDKGDLKQAGEVIKKYFVPGFVKGRVVSDLGESIAGVQLKVNGQLVTTTNNDGYYFIAVPVGEHEILFTHPDFFQQKKLITIGHNQERIVSPSLDTLHKDWWYLLHKYFPFSR